MIDKIHSVRHVMSIRNADRVAQDRANFPGVLRGPGRSIYPDDDALDAEEDEAKEMPLTGIAVSCAISE